MGTIRGGDGKQIGYLFFDLDSGEVTAPIVIKVKPEGGETLKSSADADVQLQARLFGAAGAWTDLAGGLSMAAYVGAETQVELRAVAAAFAGEVRRFVMFLGLTKTGAAGWTV